MKSLSYAISMAAEKHKVYIAMIFIQFVYAGMALFSKAAVSKGMNPFVFVVYRQAFAFLALAPFAFFFERITLSLNLYYVAINYTSATFAAATTTAIPAITFVMAVLLRMESISIKHLHGVAKVLGSVTSLSGAVVYALIKGPPLKFMNWFPENLDHQIHPKSSRRGEWIKGSLIMLSANTAWSLWLILQGPIVKEYPAKLRLTALQCFFSCMQSAFWTIAIERRPSAWKIGWDIHLLAVVYCGVIVTGITYWLQVWAIQKKGPVFTAMFTPLALIITAIFSAILWKEAIYWGSIGGGVLLVAGLYSVLWGKKKEDQKSRENEQKQENKEEVLIV
ncbi:WAT1-related protein At1g43650 isoform X2 [Rosa chinensis]|uniref:WAT1-related protein At1g43650 isoform X2 n=1 Tax=Rosa chinensis TaxID=74649 RepID=UPI000D08AC15|nr:WAT1-related protein At1g43650 isoform X2 [Rosa chinensis]